MLRLTCALRGGLTAAGVGVEGRGRRDFWESARRLGELLFWLTDLRANLLLDQRLRSGGHFVRRGWDLCGVWNNQHVLVRWLFGVVFSVARSGRTYTSSCYPPYVKPRLSSTSVLPDPNQEDSSSEVRLSWLLLFQSRSRSDSPSRCWSRFWSWAVPNTPLKTFWSSHDWQLSVTSLSRRARELRGLRLRRKTLRKTRIEDPSDTGSSHLCF